MEGHARHRIGGSLALMAALTVFPARADVPPQRPWLELRSPHFRVMGDAGDGNAEVIEAARAGARCRVQSPGSDARMSSSRPAVPCVLVHCAR